MRSTALLIAVLLLVHLSATSQTITFSGKDVAMKKVFQVVEEQTGHVISGERSILTSLKPVSLSVENIPVEQFLNLVFKDQGITYRFRGNNTFLSRKAPPPNPNRTPAPATTSQPALVTGTVRSHSGELLIGVSIRVKGTQSGTTTDAQGSFRLNIERSTVLQISSIGYETLEVSLRETADGYYTATAVKPDMNDNVKAGAGRTVDLELI